ncbi:MAG: glycosyltransferase family 2 protein, partial [Pseudomonadota bacterium]
MAKVYVATVLSNEAPYLLEWVAHYRGMGFAGAILFTHDCADGTEAMVARLAEMGHVHGVPLKAGVKDPMRKAMRDLPDIARGLGAEWCLPAHIDEFLNVSAGAGRVEDLIKACDGAEVISICRRTFGSSGHRGIPAGQLRESHRLTGADTAKGPMVTRGIKTLFRLDAINRAAPHRPFFPDGAAPNWVDAGGQPMPEAYLTGKWTAHKD